MACSRFFIAPCITVVYSCQTELEIAEIINTVEMSGITSTKFLVYMEDGAKHTLPSIKTDYVCGYHVGDMLPVVIKTYGNGQSKMEVYHNVIL